MHGAEATHAHATVDSGGRRAGCDEGIATDAWGAEGGAIVLADVPSLARHHPVNHALRSLRNCMRSKGMGAPGGGI